jgi:hypothetical protein
MDFARFNTTDVVDEDRLVGLPLQLSQHRRVRPQNQTTIVLIIVLIVLSAFTIFLQNLDQYTHVTSGRTISTSLKSVKDDVDGTAAENTNYNYTWQGNTSVWIPPEGVPYLYPSDIRRIFQSENTLWIGDSTARQDYQTMFSLMNGNGKNITDDNRDVLGLDRDAAFLNKNINKGKGAIGKIASHCH